MGKGSNTFRLSNLMPYSCFYHLKNMRSRGNRVSRAQKAHNSLDKSEIPRTEPLKSPPIHSYITDRLSYYIPTEDRTEQLPLSPTPPKKSKKRPKKKPLSSSALNSETSPGTPLRRLDDGLNDEFIVSASDIAIDAHNLSLPPILTKPKLINGRKQSRKQGRLLCHDSMRSPSGTQQIKLRIKSPKLVQKRVVKRKGFADSFVVVKSSSDPKRDFRESMVDMIVENNLFSWKELEELLACYLLLNSSEFHGIIVGVFEKIWFDLAEIIV